MKKLVTLLCGGAIALSLFAAPGAPVKAAETENCACHDLVPITGAERNKLVADFLSSEAFKAEKLELLQSGYSWNGAQSIEVVLPSEDVTMVGVPFVDSNGVSSVYVFINGTFVGTSPVE